MTPEERAKLTTLAAKAARIALDIATGDRADAAVAAKEVMLLAADWVPVDELKEFLAQRDRIFDDLEADVLEQIKLDSLKK